ncbi:hypothetical protein V8G54_008541 [Vigna mungo]|uniref:Dof zinc finger protein n=1 Tax=Vigna mungo TaxID=3915 RepID=A0AAQ3S6K0_VIGMU
MQDIHSICGGDRRLRQHHHHHQPLKCPRCDSLNTKFCYYNNYNLSQPRHFCKNCRRYWTKGGVLRNVPVGGGCRKSKRSNKPKTTANNTNDSSSNNNNNPSPSSQIAPATASTTPSTAEPERNSNSHSSSESSTLTVTEAMSAPTSNTLSSNALFLDNVRESKLFATANNPSLEGGGVFSEIGSFSGLIASNNESLGFGFGNCSNNNGNSNSNILDATTFRFGVTDPQGNNNDEVQVAAGGEQQQNHHQEFGTASFLDLTAPVEFCSLAQKSGHHGGFGSLDWQAGGDQGLFDLPNTIDQTYWSQSHWSDQDNPSLFHLP